MKKLFRTFSLIFTLIVISAEIYADGFGWHFSTVPDYESFIKFFNDGKIKPLNSSDMDFYYEWYEKRDEGSKKDMINKKVISHLLSGKVDYESLSIDEANSLDIFIRFFIYDTSSYPQLKIEPGIDSISNWCFGDYLDLRHTNPTVAKLFASGRRINTNNPIACKENTKALEQANFLVEKEVISKEQLNQIKNDIVNKPKNVFPTCYYSYFVLSPKEVKQLVNELTPVIKLAKFHADECPLNTLYEYLKVTSNNKNGIYAWTSD